MPPSRVTPLAGWSIVAIFVLIGGALLSTVWTTRSSVVSASDAVGRGDAIAVREAVRADVAEVDGVPTTEDLQDLLDLHREEGLRYIAMTEGHQVVAAAGTAVTVGPDDDDDRSPRLDQRLTLDHGRIRLTLRGLRRMKAGGRALRYVVEIEPVQANALRDASTLTLMIGAIAAATLLGVAFVLVRREARRAREERERERERRLASLGEMSAVLAHEIKNPLASLKGNAQLLAQMIAKALPEGEKARSKAERVVDEAIRLEKLTNDLLRFVRTGAINREPVSPAAIAREAVDSVLAAKRAGEGTRDSEPVIAHVTIAAESAPKTWPLDGERIREVLINLVDNAIAAGPPVEVRLRVAGGRLLLEVEDRGPGVPADEREKIFEPFFTGKTQGTGLGLAVARRVVELHGGTLAVHESPHGGALFRAEIPES
jgi:two-component system, NtrC family, sensor histidine kinase HydH